jgi:arsenite methyltransferase
LLPYLTVIKYGGASPGGLMAVTCSVDLDTVRLRNEIRSIYARVASAPDGEFHFHRGPEYARDFLRYDSLALARIPPFAVESFAGVGNPLRIEPITAGATVVDIGCGSGTDLLLAANAVGPRGRAVGIDMTDAMLRKARAAATEAGLTNVDLRQGDLLELPIESASADVVMSNGVLNLAPDKRRAFSEVLRVLRPGGRFLYADIVVAAELPESIRGDIDLWSG